MDATAITRNTCADRTRGATLDLWALKNEYIYFGNTAQAPAVYVCTDFIFSFISAIP